MFCGVLCKHLPGMRETRGSIPESGRSAGEGNGKPTPVLLPGEPHGGRSLIGYSPWGRKESDKTERFHFHSNSMSNFLKNCQTVFHSSYAFYIPTSNT